MPIEKFSGVGQGFEWVDITNPNADELKEVSKEYALHRYTLLDVLQPDHLPKYEKLSNAEFFITRIYNEKATDTLGTIQSMTSKVAIFYNTHFIITIHRLPQPFLKGIFEKYVLSSHCLSPAEVATKILWHVLQSFELPAGVLTDQVDDNEARIFLRSNVPVMLEDLYYIKRKASLISKILFLTGNVIIEHHSTEADKVAVQDVRDLHLKITTAFHTVHEDVGSLLNTYLSLSSHRSGEVMKVLTLFSVFFMPLTFLVGIYGMNFQFMPELRYAWGYPAIWLVMIIISGAIYLWFRRKKWL
jgi:magnesium transporter